MLNSFERGNINKRLAVLKVIFNIEDSIVKIIKSYFPTNKNQFANLVAVDVEESKFISNLQYRSNSNKSLKTTFSGSEMKIHDFLERATMGDLISIMKFMKPGLKRQIAPKEWNFKQTMILLGQLTILRNKVSHSSLMPVDDHIYALKEVSKFISEGENDRKKQYTIVLKKLAEHYNLGVQNIFL